MQKLRVSKYIQQFHSEDPVSAQTIKNWISSGQLQGEMMGGLWFVHVSEPTISKLDSLLQCLEVSQ